MTSDDSDTYDLLVIGGGAAGYFTAIQCASAHVDNVANVDTPAKRAKIGILEATGKTLTKVKISGGGRCNVTHNQFVPKVVAGHYPRGHKELLGPLTKFGPRETIAWFEHHGVNLVAEPDGRMFPDTNRSETIVTCLETQIAKHHIDRITLTMVQQITPLESGFCLKTRQGKEYRCRYLCLATGGSPAGHKLAEDLGLTLVPPVPSLFTFQVDDPLLHQRAGIALGPPFTPSLTLSVKSDELTNKPLRQFHQVGTVLITHWGLSGPGVLKLSAFAARELFAADYQALLTINWLHPQSFQEIYQKITQLKPSLGKKQITNVNPFPFARSFWDLILAKQQIPTHKNLADLSHDEITRIVQGLTQDRFLVSGKGVFKEEFVTAGGVSCDEINFKTMATKKLPRLYCVGEVVNIDGVTGGFNFQNAWTSGYLAGSDLGRMLGKSED